MGALTAPSDDDKTGKRKRPSNVTQYWARKAPQVNADLAMMRDYPRKFFTAFDSRAPAGAASGIPRDTLEAALAAGDLGAKSLQETPAAIKDILQSVIGAIPGSSPNTAPSNTGIDPNNPSRFFDNPHARSWSSNGHVYGGPPGSVSGRPLTDAERAVLNTIAHGELDPHAPDPYAGVVGSNVTGPSQPMPTFARHPFAGIPTSEHVPEWDPRTGALSRTGAAGRYQFQPGSWATETGALGIGQGMWPANQDAATLADAARIYGRDANGRTLVEAQQANAVDWKRLAGEWQSIGLPGWRPLQAPGAGTRQGEFQPNENRNIVSEPPLGRTPQNASARPATTFDIGLNRAPPPTPSVRFTLPDESGLGTEQQDSAIGGQRLVDLAGRVGSNVIMPSIHTAIDDIINYWSTQPPPQPQR